jgi:hypothetical protein
MPKKIIKRSIANPNPASINLNVNPFTAVANGIAPTTAAFDAKSLNPKNGQVTVYGPQMLWVTTKGGAVKLTIGVVDPNGVEIYTPIGVFAVGPDAQTTANNFPMGYVLTSDGTLTFIDTCADAKKMFELYIVIQRKRDNAVAIIDPGISHDGASLGGGRGR